MAGSVREVAAYGGAVDWEAGDSIGAPPTDPSAAPRLERAAADARLQAFAVGDPCRDLSTKVDFDRAPRAQVRNSVLFQKQAGDADAVDSRDVRQGRLGDCYLLAVLGSMASTPKGRDFLRNAIVENKNDAGEVVSYTVTLREPRATLFGWPKDHPVPVTVDPLFVAGHALARQDGSVAEVWPLVVEKACAMYLGGYNRLGRGGQPADAMALLTGQSATATSFDWPDRWFDRYSVADLKSDIAKGHLVVFTSRAEIDDSALSVIPEHGYFARGLEERDGKTFVLLGNPWGGSDPAPVPFDELTGLFTAVHVGSLR